MKRRTNGAGHVRQKPDGRWEALYYVNGVRRSIQGRKGETAADVQKRLNEALHNLDRGIEAPKDGRQTLGEYLDSWLITKKPELEYSTWVSYEGHVRNHIKPALGRTPLVKLTPQQLQRFYAERVEHISSGTVRNIHATLSNALGEAARLDLITRNVADLVHPPKVIRQETKTYTHEQAMQFLEAAKGDRLGAQFVLLATTGMRLGETLGLRWEALDLDRGELHVELVLKDVKNKRTLGAPKTERGRRTILLTSNAVAFLRQHHIDQTVERIKHRAGWNPNHLVFCTTNGTAYARSNWHYEEWRPFLENAGLPYVKPHRMRHTHSSHLIMAGVPVLVVSERLGHASPAFTQAVYGHVQDQMRTQNQGTIEQLYGQSASPEK